jgi:hypothetical protein
VFGDDVVAVRHAVALLPGATPNPNFNEKQRMDTTDDGDVDGSDIVGVRLIAAFLAPNRPAQGPTGYPDPVYTVAGAPVDGTAPVVDDMETNRVIGVGPVSASPGGRLTTAVTMASQGDEVATSFTLSYDASKLSNPSVELASGLPADAVLTVNTTIEGRLAVVVDSTQALSGGTLVNITFDVERDAAGGTTALRFDDSLARRSVADAYARRLPARYRDGVVTIAGAAQIGIEMSGRVTDPSGRGLRNARVSIADDSGIVQSVLTNAFGRYHFDGLAAGRKYTVSAASGRYRFASRTLQVNDSLTDVDFAAQE